MSLKKSKIKLFVFLFAFMFGMTHCFAQNMLSKTEISQIGNNYKIAFSMPQQVKIKKQILSANKIILTLPNVSALPTYNTVYKNAKNIDNVVVEQVSNNSLKVIIEGKDISNSEIGTINGNNFIGIKDFNKHNLNFVYILAGLVLFISLFNRKKNKDENSKNKEFLKNIQNNELTRLQNLEISDKINAVKQKRFSGHVLNSYQSNPQSKRINIDSTHFAKSLTL